MELKKNWESCPLSKVGNDLFSDIAGRLSLEEISCLRSVCKAWNTSLLDVISQVLGRAPMPTILRSLRSGYPNRHTKGEIFAAYDTKKRIWQRWTAAANSINCSRYKVHGQVGNLLLVEHMPYKMGFAEEKKIDRCQNLRLVNSVKKSQAGLPNLPEASVGVQRYLRRRGPSISFISGESPDSFKVLISTRNVHLKQSSQSVSTGGQSGGRGAGQDLDAAERGGRDLPEDVYSVIQSKQVYEGFLYDSILDSWRVVGTWEETIRDDESVESLVFYEGALYGVRKFDTSFSTWARRGRVCVYDERKSCWQELPSPFPTEESFDIFAWQGHLMGTSMPAVLKNNKRRLYSIRIWQLDEKNGAWAERARMPNDLLDSFLLPEILGQDVPMGTFHVIPSVSFELCGHYIWWTSQNSDYTVFKNVMYDISKNEWWTIPEAVEPGPELEAVSDQPSAIYRPFYDCHGFSVFKPKTELQ